MLALKNEQSLSQRRLRHSLHHQAPKECFTRVQRNSYYPAFKYSRLVQRCVAHLTALRYHFAYLRVLDLGSWTKHFPVSTGFSGLGLIQGSPRDPPKGPGGHGSRETKGPEDPHKGPRDPPRDAGAPRVRGDQGTRVPGEPKGAQGSPGEAAANTQGSREPPRDKSIKCIAKTCCAPFCIQFRSWCAIVQAMRIRIVYRW